MFHIQVHIPIQYEYRKRHEEIVFRLYFSDVEMGKISMIMRMTFTSIQMRSTDEEEIMIQMMFECIKNYEYEFRVHI